MVEKLQNQWLAQNNIQVQRIKRQLIEYGYKGGEDIPGGRIQAVLESAIIEIGRLQRELDSANLEIKQLKSKDAETVTKKDGE